MYLKMHTEEVFLPIQHKLLPGFPTSIIGLQEKG